MQKFRVFIPIVLGLAIAGCSQDPQDKQANAIESEADAVRERADGQADMMENRADSMDTGTTGMGTTGMGSTGTGTTGTGTTGSGTAAEQRLNNEAQSIRDRADAKAGAMENQADTVRDSTPRP